MTTPLTPAAVTAPFRTVVDNDRSATHLIRTKARFTRLIARSKQPDWPTGRKTADNPKAEWITTGVIPTGGLFIIDIDEREPQHAAVYATLIANGIPTQTFTVRTPSGGLHLYYHLDLHPAERPVFAGPLRALIPGINGDIRTGFDGYVLAPFSETPDGWYLPVRNGSHDHIATIPRPVAQRIATILRTKQGSLNRQALPVLPSTLPVCPAVPPKPASQQRINGMTLDVTSTGYLTPSLGTITQYARTLPDRTAQASWETTATKVLNAMANTYQETLTATSTPLIGPAHIAGTPAGELWNITARLFTLVCPTACGVRDAKHQTLTHAIAAKRETKHLAEHIIPDGCDCGRADCNRLDCTPTLQTTVKRVATNRNGTPAITETTIGNYLPQLKSILNTYTARWLANHPEEDRVPYHQQRGYMIAGMLDYYPEPVIIAAIRHTGLDTNWNNGNPSCLTDLDLAQHIRRVNAWKQTQPAPTYLSPFAPARLASSTVNRVARKTEGWYIDATHAHQRAFRLHDWYRGHHYATVVNREHATRALEVECFGEALTTPKRIDRAQKTTKSAWRTFHLARIILFEVIDMHLQGGIQHIMLNNTFLLKLIKGAYGNEPAIQRTLTYKSGSERELTIPHIKQAKRALMNAGLIYISRRQYSFLNNPADPNGGRQQGTAFFAARPALLDEWAGKCLRRVYATVRDHQASRHLRLNDTHTGVICGLTGATPGKTVMTFTGRQVKTKGERATRWLNPDYGSRWSLCITVDPSADLIATHLAIGRYRARPPVPA